MQRNDAHQRILDALGDQALSIGDIAIKTGIANWGVRSALRGMHARGEVRRIANGEQFQFKVATKKQGNAA